MVWSCFKNKSNYLSCYGKSPLPQGQQNPSIIEQQQLWCSAWLTKALAIEILPWRCLHSREPCASWQVLSGTIAPQDAFVHLCRVFPCSGNTFHLCSLRLLGIKNKIPHAIFSQVPRFFFVWTLFLWSLHELDFKLISLNVPRNYDSLTHNALRGCIILGIQLTFKTQT